MAHTQEHRIMRVTTPLGDDELLITALRGHEEISRLFQFDLTLISHFKPAFLGRLKVVPFFPITDNNLRVIVRLKLNKIAKRMQKNRRIRFLYDDEVVEAIGSRCTKVDSGARNIDHIKVSLDTQGQFAYSIEKKQ